ERHLHTADLVDQSLESGEIDLDVVVDRGAGELANRLDHQGGAAVGIRGVDLSLAVPFDRHPGVPGNAQDLGSALGRVDSGDHHHVTPGSLEVAELLRVDALAAVAADQQEV